MVHLARDAFSLMHFPMLLGVIAFAFAVEEVMAHPDEPLSYAIRLSLAPGLLLFAGGMAAAIWRATGIIHWTRAPVTLISAAAILIIVNVIPHVTLAIAFVGIVTLAILEERAGTLLSR